MPRILVCITGASGSAYALRLLGVLSGLEGLELHVVASDWGRRVVGEETGLPLEKQLESMAAGARDRPACARIAVHAASDLSAPLASGSFRLDATVIVPASMGTIGALASGCVGNLVHRAGAVALKEGWPLVLVPRESPLSLVDLRNLTALAEAGAVVMPASPAFYNRPSSVEDLVDGLVSRIIDRLGLPNPLARPWTGLHTTPKEPQP